MFHNIISNINYLFRHYLSSLKKTIYLLYTYETFNKETTKNNCLKKYIVDHGDKTIMRHNWSGGLEFESSKVYIV